MESNRSRFADAYNRYVATHGLLTSEMISFSGQRFIRYRIDCALSLPDVEIG
jgi:hypothetical protein